MRTGVAAMAIAIGGCGDNAAPVQLDVEVYGDGGIALIAYRDADGPWRTPRVASSMGNDTFYVLEVATEYEAQVVCADPAGFTVNTVYGMRDDTSPAIGCFFESSGVPVTTFAVTGKMLQPGSVDMDGSASSQTPGWAFRLQVPQGLHDLIAMPDPRSSVQAAVIRRGEDIEGPTTEPTIDLATEGLPLVRIPLVVSGIGSDDFVDAFASVETRYGRGLLPIANGVEVLPASSLLSGESQSFTLHDDAVSSTGLQRDAFARIDEHSQLVVQLYPRLDGVTAAASLTDNLAVTWSDLPFDDYDWLGINFGTDPAHYAVTASRAWLEAHPPSLVTHMTAPGFDPSWIPPVVPQAYCLYVDANRMGVSYSTSVCN
jgi:hypothetical protein